MRPRSKTFIYYTLENPQSFQIAENSKICLTADTLKSNVLEFLMLAKME